MNTSRIRSSLLLPINQSIISLATNQSLKKLLCKFKEGIISKFEDRLSEHNLKIQELQFKFHSQENVFKKLEIISDYRKQYSRRSCLCIHFIEFKKGDGGDKKYCDVTGISFNEKEIDRGMVSQNPSE